MKQHITIEQLNELSDKAKEKLREWWKPEEGDLVIFLQDNNHFDKETFVVGTGTFLTDKGWGVNYEDQAGLMPKENVYPLLSIGQMIEFLPNFKEITKVEGEFTDTDRENYEDLTDGEFNLVKKQ